MFIMPFLKLFSSLFELSEKIQGTILQAWMRVKQGVSETRATRRKNSSRKPTKKWHLNKYKRFRDYF